VKLLLLRPILHNMPAKWLQVWELSERYTKRRSRGVLRGFNVVDL